MDTSSSQTVNKWTSYKHMYVFYYEYNHLSVLYDSTSRMLYTVIKETSSGPEIISGLRAPPLVVSCYKCSDFEGFCSDLLMICVTVSVWHNNTQQHAQAAYSVHLESLCCWKTVSLYWTCSLIILCSMSWIQNMHFE